jgi:MFS family permease
MVLLVFGLVLAVQAFMWITFAPIESSVESVLGVGSGRVRLLALVGPVAFIFLGTFAGELTDRRGFRFTCLIGAGTITLGCALRAIVPHLGLAGESQYWLFLVLQGVIGAGAVFTLTNLSEVPIRWFRQEDRATAIGIATLFFYLGTAVGLPLVTAVASIPEGTTDLTSMSAGLNRVLWVFAAAMAVVTVLFAVLARPEPPTPSGPRPEEARISMFDALRRFIGTPMFRTLCLVSLIGYGVYVGLTVTMEKILGFHGFSSGFASYVAAGITLGGIAGSAVLPGLSERIGLRKRFLGLAAAAIVPATLVMAYLGNQAAAMSAAILLGVLLLPVLPITFTVVGEMDEIGPAFSGAAVGTMMAAGNLGVLLVPLAMEMVAGETAGVPDYRPSLVLLAALGVAALTLITLGVRETGPRSRAPDH